MDVRSLKLRLTARHVRAVVAEAGGERPVDLTEARADAVFAAAAPLLARLAPQIGGAAVRALSVDFVEDVLRASLDGGEAPALRLDGAALVPLAAELRDLARAVVSALRPPPNASAGDAVSDARFWSDLYRRGGDGWELGRPAPPLGRWLTAHPPRPADDSSRRARVLVPGCGRGHEARLCARLGADVTGVDIADEAVAAARALAERDGLTVDFRRADLFALPGAGGDLYDLVVEHTCFCAISPARRAEYAAAAFAVLRPGGALVGLFWDHGRPGGPPFSVSQNELFDIFNRYFDIEHFEVPPDSVATRAGQEMLVRFVRRAAPR